MSLMRIGVEACGDAHYWARTLSTSDAPCLSTQLTPPKVLIDTLAEPIFDKSCVLIALLRYNALLAELLKVGF